MIELTGIGLQVVSSRLLQGEIVLRLFASFIFKDFFI